MAERGVVTADTPTRNQFGTRVIQAMTYIDQGVVSKHSLGKGTTKAGKQTT